MNADTDAVFLSEEDEARELALVGLDVVPQNASQDQRDAIASYQLRAIGEIDAEIAERSRGMENEISLIRARYARLLDPLRTRRLEKEAYVRTLAQISMECGGFGKAKSRKVGYGQYGSRVKRGGLVVVDAQCTESWALINRPETLSAMVKIPLVEARQLLPAHLLEVAKIDVSKKALNEYFAASGEEIPGTIVEHDGVEFYAKPELLT